MDSELIAELRRAIQARQIKGQELVAVQGDVELARKRLQRTKEAKQLRDARRVERMIREQYGRAVEHLQAVENELHTGLSGLPLVDLPRRNCTSSQPQSHDAAPAAGGDASRGVPAVPVEGRRG